jgi:hypothetical protein
LLWLGSKPECKSLRIANQRGFSLGAPLGLKRNP